jgi:hypothetical protein
VDPSHLEALLNEDENPALDFKRDQYPFDNATDDQKSELLKDILAFANAWRRSDAYILIGVEEVKGGRSRPVGLSKHLDDADLQQFVNAKTNRKIDFRYEAVRVDATTVGVIHIPLQDRPSYLNKDYGKLKANTVYIRRGSSTDTAKPDEISKMGFRADAVPSPRLDLVARVTSLGLAGLAIILSIKNEVGSGSARAPRLSIMRRGPFRECTYGLDGNTNFGLPRMPQGSDSPYLIYGGDASMLIPAGVTHDVTCLQYGGRPDSMPDRIDIEYQLSAEGIDPIAKTLTVNLP